MEYKQIYNKSRKINVYSNLEGLHEEIIEYYLFFNWNRTKKKLYFILEETNRMA